ncbi:kinase-like domain-containing protein [Mycena sp. CBHHK59/15]|nr:kinase-like domain-containing protein [Mycena sp. CBHHK59/15]
MDIDNTLPSTHWSASTSDSDSTTPLSERRRRKPSRAISTAPSPPTTRLRSRKTNASSFSPPVPLGEPKLNLESLGLDNREIPPSKLQKLKKIGSGGFKDVFIGKFSGRRIAISEFRGRLTAMDIKELKLLGRFDHPNIIRFLGVSIPDNNRETPVMIITELCSNGDLFDNIRNVPAPSLNKVLTMMLDIARGLDYLHLGHPSVIHRDCKSSNILISAKGTAKIADFGLAKVKESTRSMVRSLVGTVNWQAPELWKAQPKYNHKVDVFSCAMVYWEMLQWHAKVKRFPWEGMNEHAIYEIVGGKKQRPSTNHLRKQWSTAIVDLIEGMWAHEHQDRPSMSEIVVALQEMNNDQAV